MTDAKKTLGRALRDLRKARGWNQEEMAHRIGRSVFTVSHIERGVGFPTVPTLIAYAEALDVPVSELMSPLD